MLLSLFLPLLLAGASLVPKQLYFSLSLVPHFVLCVNLNICTRSIHSDRFLLHSIIWIFIWSALSVRQYTHAIILYDSCLVCSFAHCFILFYNSFRFSYRNCNFAAIIFLSVINFFQYKLRKKVRRRHDTTKYAQQIVMKLFLYRTFLRFREFFFTLNRRNSFFPRQSWIHLERIIIYATADVLCALVFSLFLNIVDEHTFHKYFLLENVQFLMKARRTENVMLRRGITKRKR